MTKLETGSKQSPPIQTYAARFNPYEVKQLTDEEFAAQFINEKFKA